MIPVGLPLVYSLKYYRNSQNIYMVKHRKIHYIDIRIKKTVTAANHSTPIDKEWMIYDKFDAEV